MQSLLDKNEKLLKNITFIVMVLSVICCIVPLLNLGGIDIKSVVTTHGEEVELYGKGLYAYNSHSAAIQAIAQDMVTLILVIPAFIVALGLRNKGKIVGDFLHTGLLAYMLYTYMSYAFMMYYNSLFLVYVVLMALSFYGFVIGINLLLKKDVIDILKEKMPTKGLRIFLVITEIFICLLWMGRIVPTIGNDKAPEGLENYSTLVIQALDLGVIVPACFAINYMLANKYKIGYVIAPVIIIKAVTLVVAVLTMAVCMKITGEDVAIAEFAVFGLIFLVALYYLIKQLKLIGKFDK